MSKQTDLTAIIALFAIALNDLGETLDDFKGRLASCFARNPSLERKSRGYRKETSIHALQGRKQPMRIRRHQNR